ncbi:MAG: hypothetical protein EA403_03250 [Spirochaetaceae bacterium]|nr:MAG: hypothetical protein EA403_03250 [Spirochaetaceae bacterium]
MVGAAQRTDVASLTRNIALSNLLRARTSPGRVSVPLQGSVNYMRLKHVQGVPASEGNSGFSLSRLRMLDTMIDRLEKGARATPEASSTERAAEALYRRLADMGRPGLTGIRASEPGSFLNLLV